MGFMISKVMRPLKSFNIENRAHRVISKEKPQPAPRYPSNIEDLKRTLQSDPNIDDKLDKKDTGLDLRLKDVYVTSTGRPEDDVTKERQQQNPNRPLPQDRKLLDDFEYGFKEVAKVSYGRTTLRDAVNFISAHQTDPKSVTVEKIALEYKLKVDDVENILKYFKTYEIYIPETKKTPAVFAGPAATRKQLEKLDSEAIEDGQSDKQPEATKQGSKVLEETRIKKKGLIDSFKR